MAVIKHETYRFTELNPLLISDGIDAPGARTVGLFAGWESNYELLAIFMDHLQRQGVESYAYSPFDAIDPLGEPSQWWANSDNGVQIDLGQIPANDDYPMRMIDRAKGLLVAMRDIPDILGIVRPATAVGHCAGNNVLLLAEYLVRRNPMLGSSGLRSMLLVEPMLPYWPSALRYASKGGFADFEKAAVDDPSLIRLKDLAHPGMPDIGMNRKEPLGDIIHSRGLELARSLGGGGMLLVAVTSLRDYAAPEDRIREEIEDVYPYPDQQRFGHGYMYAEPEAAAKHTASVLRLMWQ